MSWSITAKGSPQEVAQAIDATSAQLTGNNKVEFDNMKPHLVGLVLANFVAEGASYPQPVLVLSATGSGTFRRKGDSEEFEQLEGTCVVRLERERSSA